jgi:hypothetical protein
MFDYSRYHRLLFTLLYAWYLCAKVPKIMNIAKKESLFQLFLYLLPHFTSNLESTYFISPFHKSGALK